MHGPLAWTWVLLFVVLTVSPRQLAAQRPINITGILDDLLLNYDKRLRPNHGGEPVEVEVSMYVLDISSLSEKSMEYTLDFYLRHYWTDPRLRSSAGQPAIPLGADFASRIWTPDTFIVNERRPQPVNPLTAHEFMRVDPSGAVTRSVRMSVTASCPMSLQYFPMDRQLCAIELESYGYSMSDVRYKWKDGPNSLGVSFTVTLPQFKLLGYRTKVMEVRLASGNYSRMYGEFQFARLLGSYVLQLYFPAGLVVLISWASLWLDRRPESRGSRVALAAGALLTMAALMTCTDQPRVSYLKASDVYLAFCFFMSVAALVEYAFVCYMMKRLQSTQARLRSIQQMAEEHNKEVRFEATKVTSPANGCADDSLLAKSTLEPSTVDKYARVLFPVIFVCFNLIYWVIYMHIGATPATDLTVV